MNDLANMQDIVHLIQESRWDEIQEFFNNSPQVSHLGINVNLDNPVIPRCNISKIYPFHLGGIGKDYINGGAIAAIVDLSIGLTSLKYLAHGNIATSKLNIDFLRPIEGKAFYTISKINNKIGNNLYSEVIIYNCNDKPCVYASGTIRINIKA